jgi:hypothetical protein
MGIREKMEEKKGLAVGGAIVLIALAVATIAWQLMSINRDTRNSVPNDFFTVDDGQTFFTAKASNLPPFEYQGKQAVRAAVYECDGKRFVAYMERFTPEARKAVMGAEVGPDPTKLQPKPGQSPEAAARAATARGNPAAFRDATMNGRELKRPGDKEWVRSTNRQKVAEIQNHIACPAGGKGTPVPVAP